MSLIKRIQIEENKTIILVSHDMNDVARYADEVIVLNKGRVVETKEPRALFRFTSQLEDWHITLPNIVKLQKDFEYKYNTTLPKLALNEEEFASLYRSGRMKNKLIIDVISQIIRLYIILILEQNLSLFYVYSLYFLLPFVWNLRMDIFTYNWFYEII